MNTELSGDYSWYADQIAGHNIQVVKKGRPQIGELLPFFSHNFLFSWLVFLFFRYYQTRYLPCVEDCDSRKERRV